MLHHPTYREKFKDNLRRDLPRVPFADPPQPSLEKGEETGAINHAPTVGLKEGSYFWFFSNAGKELAHWHLNYEDVEEYPLQWVETPHIPLSYKVEKMRLREEADPPQPSLTRGEQSAIASSPPHSRGHACSSQRNNPPFNSPPSYGRGGVETYSLMVNDSLTLKGIPAEALEYRLGNRSALHWIIDQYQIKTDKRSGIVSDPNRDDDPQYIVKLVGKVVRVSLETVRIVKELPELKF